MTWLTTWPLHNRPQYAAHDTEAQAAQHAKNLVDSGTTRIATYFALPDEETA